MSWSEWPVLRKARKDPKPGVPPPPPTAPCQATSTNSQPPGTLPAHRLGLCFGCRVLDCDNCGHCDTRMDTGFACPQSVRSQCDNCGQIFPGKSKGVRSFLALVSGASECKDLQRGNSSRTPPPTGGPHGSKGGGITYQH